MKMLIALSILGILLIPFSANAISFAGKPFFGGFVSAVTPCTCPPYGLLITYSTLFLNSNVPIKGTLYYPPSAILYAHYAMVPDTWELGFFNTGGICQQMNPTNAETGNPDPCHPPLIVNALGSILGVGTSLPSPKFGGGGGFGGGGAGRSF